MKLLTPLTAVVALTLISTVTSEAEPRSSLGGPMRDAPTHDQLSQSLRMAQQKDPIQNIGPAIGKTDEDPSAKYGERDLIKESTILCYRGFLTLVPKQAVLHLPPKLKDRFEAQPNIQVQPWAEFFQANRGWIRTVEVTREQAMGIVAMPEELVESFKTSSSAVVATFKGGPISVLPVPEPEPQIEAESSDPAVTSTSSNTVTKKP